MSWLLLAMLILVAASVARGQEEGLSEPPEALAAPLDDEAASAMLFSIEELDELRLRPLDLDETDAATLARLPGISIRKARRIIAWSDTAQRGLPYRSIEWLARDERLALQAWTRRRGPGHPKRSRGRLRLRLEREIERRRGYDEQLTRLLPRRDSSSGRRLYDTIGLGPIFTGPPTAVLTDFRVVGEGIDAALRFSRRMGESIALTDTSGYSYRQRERISPRQRVTAEIGSHLVATVGGHLELDGAAGRLVLGDYRVELGGERNDEERTRPTPGDPTGWRGLVAGGSPTSPSSHRGLAIESPRGILPPFPHASYLFWWSDRRRSARVDTTPGGLVTTSFSDGEALRTRSDARRGERLRDRRLGLAALDRRRGWRSLVAATLVRFDPPLAGSRALPRREVVIASGSMLRTRREEMLELSTSVATDGALRLAGALSSRVGRWGWGIDLVHERGSFVGEGPLAAGPISPGMARLSLGGSLRGEPIDDLQCDLILVAGMRSGGALSVDESETACDLALRWQASPTFSIAVSALARHAPDEIGHPGERGNEPVHLMRNDRRLRAELLVRSPGGRTELRTRFDERCSRWDGLEREDRGTALDCRLTHAPGAGLRLRGRGLIFATDGAFGMIYAGDQDIPGRPHSETLAGRGLLSSLSLSWQPTPSVALAMQYQEVRYVDREGIGEGADRIEGNRRGEWALQIELRL